jgi:hypothetical protein
MKVLESLSAREISLFSNMIFPDCGGMRWPARAKTYHYQEVTNRCCDGSLEKGTCT